MPADHYLRMSVAELVEALGSHADPGSKRNEEIKAALQVRLAEEQSKPTRRANLALGIAGVSALGSAATVIDKLF